MGHRTKFDGTPDKRCNPNAKPKQAKDSALRLLPPKNAADQNLHDRLRTLDWEIIIVNGAPNDHP